MKQPVYCPDCGKRFEVDVPDQPPDIVAVTKAWHERHGLPAYCCPKCYALRVQRNHANDNLPVGKASCSEAYESQVILSGCGGKACQCGGGRRIVRKSEPMAG